MSDSTDPGVLRAALAALSDSDQEVLRLVAWDGLTPAGLATVLGCTPVAARTRLHRARARLARKLGVDQKLGVDRKLGVDPEARQQREAPRHKQGDSPDSVEVPR